jgi:hypothetical protein
MAPFAGNIKRVAAAECPENWPLFHENADFYEPARKTCGAQALA